MLRIERYLFRTVANTFLGSLATLTGIIWVTQALKQLDLMTNKGQTILVFLTITGLGVPFLTAMIAPVALFASVVYSLNKLNGDSELVVMSAAGIPPWRLLRPYLAMFAVVFFTVAALDLEIIPSSFELIQSLTARIHGDFIANFARPGPFTELEAGFVFHYRERGDDGSLRGLFIEDRRNPDEVAIYIAERGDIVEKNGDSYLLLEKGSTQRPRSSGDASIITFDDYAIDLAEFIRKGDALKKPRERDTWSLLSADPNTAPANMVGPIRAEVYDRFTSPLYAFTAGLIGFAALGEARTTRQGRGWAILASILMFALIRVAGITDSLLLRGKPGVPLPLWIPMLAWAIPIVSAIVALDYIFNGPLAAAASRALELAKPSRRAS